jgi:DcaP outer membrane protein
VFQRRRWSIRALLLASLPVVARAEEPRAFRFEVRGFAELDYVQAFQGVDPNWEAALRPSRIATDPSEYGSEPVATLSVRQSRLGAYADAPLAGSDVHTALEFDFFGVGKDEGQTTIRLRHAFGEWGWLLAGQTNSLFMDGDVFPDVIEYWGPAGMVLYRNPQIRFTLLRGTNSLAFAVERPGTVIDQGTQTGSFESQSALPDVTAQYRFSLPAGHVQLAGLARDLGYRTTGSVPDRTGHEVGWGAHASSVATIGPRAFFPRATLRLSAVYGHGIANYMNDGGVDVAPTASGSFQAEPQLGTVAYLDLALCRQFETSVGYSFTQVQNSSGQAASAFRRGDYASATLLFFPLASVLTGASYTWGRRTDADGNTGIDQRAQLTIKYSFSSVFER